MRSIEMSARTVEDALEAACQALGVDRDDLNVSYEVLEFPARKLFKTIPAKVRVTVEEPETTAPVAEAPAAVETAAPVAEPAAPVEAAPETPAETPAEAPAALAKAGGVSVIALVVSLSVVFGIYLLLSFMALAPMMAAPLAGMAV